ncbi:GGDEF domain-containing protein [Rhodopseudomonas sp. HC1]|uniref:GGDEF domain-containing protein n=1 Tax=Rhodopseudomonas infernalis TaxID=2897386 RepID=UPI001EE7C9B8|nr:GGDEF domain-containing protein [Rhodopseudomonas infernalis]MCG6203269.1 GGDEF domain-containing protein [Rhodopseudomonas infernalis]
MPHSIVTRYDVMRYTAGRVAIAGGLTALVTMGFLITDLGTNETALVPVGTVAHASMTVALTVSILLSGVMSYRSAKLMQQLALTRAELIRVSRTDPLTGLLNRRGFDEAASALLAKAATAGHRVVAVMCDIDRFKAINDRYGHEVGDRVLAEVGEILRDFGARNDLLIARHGGEEFAGLMIDVGDEKARRCVQALCRLCSTKIGGGVVDVPVTMSFGLATHVAGSDLSALMRRADQALYRAKELGRNCVVQLDDVEAAIAC